MNGDQAPAGGLGGPSPCNGVVKKWLGEKGFGFLVPEGGGEDIFVHRRALVGVYELTEGDSVVFQAEFEEKTGKWKAHTCSLPGGGGGSGAPPGADGGRGKGGKGGGKKGGGKGGRGGKGGEGGGMDMQWEMAMDTLGGAMGTLQPGGKKGGAKGGNKGGKGGRGGAGGFVDKGVYGGPGDLGMAMGMPGGGPNDLMGMGMPGGMPQQGGQKGGKGGKNNGGGKGGGQFGQMDQMGGFGNPNGGNPALIEQQIRFLQQQQAQHEAELDQRGAEPQMQVVAQLPMNWVQLRGPDGTFFVNSSTRQVTQDVPMELRQLAAQQQQDQGMPPQQHMQQQMPPQQYGQQGQAAAPAMQQGAPQQGVTTVKASVGDWLVCEDDQGTFYRDQRTGETYDEAPPELIRLAQQTQQQQQQPQPRMDEQMYHQQQQQVHQMPYAGAGGFGGDPYGGRPPFDHQSM